MNAVTQTEARAIETAAPLEMADPSKNLILVALSQLLPRRSKRNARKMPRLSILELAASIARIGLLQNLIVIASADGEHYEVVAGDRRLTALKLLAKKHRIPADYEVPCLLVADGSARTVSLAENLMREQTRAEGKRPGPDRGASLEGERPMTRTTTSRPRMAAIYAPGTVRARRWHGDGDVRGYRPPSGWSARADLTDIHPITGRALPRAVWWLIETKE